MRIWKDMTRDEIGEIADVGTAIVAVGAIEQHGMHLPVSTDYTVLSDILTKSARKVPENLPIVVTPMLPFGFSHHHFIYPGALSLSTDTLMKVLYELVEGVVKSGFKKIFILNGHGGNEECVRITARNISLHYPVTTLAASYWTLAWEAMVDYAKGNGITDLIGHAGQLETSYMLAIQPHLVKLNRMEGLPQRESKPAHFKGLLERPRVENHDSWKRIDGYTDNPLSATTDIGNELLDLISTEVAKQIVSFHLSQ